MADDKRTLSDRLEELQLREASDADEEIVERARQSKQELAGLLEGDEGRAFSDRLRRLQAEQQRAVGPGLPRERLVSWFLGHEEQDQGRGVVTPVGPRPNGWKEIDFYAVDPPYAFVRLLQDETTGERRYEALEPPLDQRAQQVRAFVHEALVRGLRDDPGRLDAAQRREFLRNAVDQVLRDYRIRIDRVNQQRVEYYIQRDFLGLGPIHPLMMDPHIEDVSCDGAAVPVFVFHREHEAMPSSIRFTDEGELDGFVIRMAQQSGKAISISEPILDAALPDGSRLQATLGKEVTENGSTFTIRRFRPDPFTPLDLIRFGTMSPELLAWFWMIVENGHSLVFSGGTASGKTTSLNAICQFIPQQSKVVSIEDTREVNLPHQNWIKAVTRSGSTAEGVGEIGMFELLKAALRQRPEYILVGEVRGVEATVAFQAMATGHTVYSTMHADSARSVVYRLENDPINIPRLVLQALDVIAIQGQVRYSGHRVRRVREVVELVGMDPATRELLTNRVFDWDPTADRFVYAGRSYMLERIARERNMSVPDVVREFDRRTQMMRRLAERDVKINIAHVVRAYTLDPDATWRNVMGDAPDPAAPAGRDTGAAPVGRAGAAGARADVAGSGPPGAMTDHARNDAGAATAVGARDEAPTADPAGGDQQGVPGG